MEALFELPGRWLDYIAEFASNNATLVFFIMGGCGLHGWYGLMRWNRENVWWMRTAAIMCFVGFTSAGRWMPDMMRIERERTDQVANERIGSKPVQTLPDGSVRLATDRRYLDRYEQVSEEIGPPPHPDAIPVLGYTTTAGISYQARWRMPPNSDKADNLKAQ